MLYTIIIKQLKISGLVKWTYFWLFMHLGDTCIVFENFTPTIGDLMVGN
jgi:hypothetical protein